MARPLHSLNRPRSQNTSTRAVVDPLEPRRLLTVTYAATQLTQIDRHYASVSITGMNREGDLAGWARDGEGHSHGFIYYDDTLIQLDDANSIDHPFIPQGINDLLEMSGTITDSDVPEPAVAVFTPDSAPHWTTRPLRAPQRSLSVVDSINDLGQVVGGYADPGTIKLHPGYWNADGSFHQITGTGFLQTYDMNDVGQLAGQQNHLAAFLWDGSIHNVGFLGGDYTEPAAINDAGAIVGQGSTRDRDRDGKPIYHPFLYSNGTMRDLGTLGADSSVRFNDFARDINNSGVVVGVASVSAAKGDAFVYDGAMHDLNDLVTNVPPGWVLYEARLINDRGQIVAEGRGPDGSSGNFLLNPVAIPPQQINGVVWNDANHNGVRDPGEAGLSSIAVYLDLNHNGKLDKADRSTITDSRGGFAFPDLSPGSYTVREVVPRGYAATAPLSYSATVTIGPDQGRAVDFGDVPIASVPMNFGFLLTVAQNIGHAGTFADGDLNGDGWVDFSDLLLLAQNYGHALPRAK